MNARRHLLAAAFATACLSGCGPEPSLVPVSLELAIDFSANALLELHVVDQASADCATLLAAGGPGDADVVAFDADPANALNGGGSLTFELEELPAERPLAFYARATEGAATLAQDCDPDVVVPAGGHVDVQLVVAEP
jgi:hypothetical protein